MHFITMYEARILHVLDRVALKTNESFRKNVLNRAQKRIDEKHPDREFMNLFPVPLIIIGSKYDSFFVSILSFNQLQKKMNSDDQVFITKSLRFIAHTYGAALFVSHVIHQQTVKVYEFNRCGYDKENSKLLEP